jgi:hypothetical protein
LSTNESEYRVVAEVARVTGGEKMDVVSDSGEEDIQVHASGWSDFADLTAAQETSMVEENYLRKRCVQNTGAVARKTRWGVKGGSRMARQSPQSEGDKSYAS